MGAVGLAQGYPNHLWYTWLDRFLPGKSLMTCCKKIAADQLICSPISSASFFVGAGMLEGCSLTESWQEYKTKFLMVYLVSNDLQFAKVSFIPNVCSFYRLIAPSGLPAN